MGIAKNNKSAKRSGGPKTTKGKEICSANSLTHGCTGKQILMPGESEADYNQVWKLWIHKYGPNSEWELDRIRDVVNAAWRKQRSEQTLARCERKLLEEQPDPSLWTEDQHKRLQLFRRYATADENSFLKFLKVLEARVKADRDERKEIERLVERRMKQTGEDADDLDNRTYYEDDECEPYLVDSEPEPGDCTCAPCLTALSIRETKALSEINRQQRMAESERNLDARLAEHDKATDHN